ncbi:acyl-CoA N-acyltransferase [Atractiella rhizophila]|nr:acyl-CoA N-acyltransferase [Atractiella rhizophila]
MLAVRAARIGHDKSLPEKGTVEREITQRSNMSIPQVTFYSARLVYRACRKEDIKTFLEIFDSHALLATWGESKPPTEALWEEAFKRFEKSPYFVAVCLPHTDTAATTHPNGDETPKSGQVIGYVALYEPQRITNISKFSIMLGSNYRGKGYGREALLWLLEKGFQHLNLHKIESGVASWNEPAKKLYASIGFQTEGVVRESIFMGGKWYDYHCIGLLQREWRERYGKEN